MDSTDIRNALVLNPNDLPPEVKEIFSRLEVGDKLEISNATVTLVENGEKVVHFSLDSGDSVCIKDPSNPEAEPIMFEMGDVESAEEEAGESDEEEAAESEGKNTKSAAVESMTADEPEPEEPEAPESEK